MMKKRRGFNLYPKVIRSLLIVLLCLGSIALPSIAQVSHAQTFELEGQRQLERGQAAIAFERWQQAETLYAQKRDRAGVTRSQINQAAALQALGLHKRAISLLHPLTQSLPPSRELVVALRSLGDALLRVGDPTASESLEKSLAIAERLGNPEELAATHLSLLNATLPGAAQEAEQHYHQAIKSSSITTQVQAHLSWLQRLINDSKPLDQIRPLIPQIKAQLNDLSPSHTTLSARLHLAQRWIEVEQLTEIGHPNFREIAQYLLLTSQAAHRLQDVRLESLALGQVGKLYQQTRNWQVAQTLTQRALALSEHIQATDLSYQWQWQLGQLLRQQGQTSGAGALLLPKAIAAYTDALESLSALRADLISGDRTQQVSFSRTIEPLHREFVSLLLQDQNSESLELEQARTTIESLQLAELENFFQEACLTVQSVSLEQLDPQAAVIYPILLSDRMEVIVSLPKSPLRHHTIARSADQIESVTEALLTALNDPELTSLEQILPGAQKLYQWLIQPIEATLDADAIKTLVFVLDGKLRSVPMSVLHDGQHYLIEKYSVAIAPSLQLLAPQSKALRPFNILLAGLSQGTPDFPPLANVSNEITTIQTIFPNRSQVLRDRDFTRDRLQATITDTAFPIVHLATHGQFSSDRTQTFIVTADGEIRLDELKTLLQRTILARRQPLELLVLSACQTATGDDQAALGLAGVAVRSGARSTMASLWQVSDASTANLMQEFYRQWTIAQTTKAEALRQAQLSLLRQANYQHPFFWSAIVLVGDWQ